MKLGSHINGHEEKSDLKNLSEIQQNNNTFITAIQTEKL